MTLRGAARCLSFALLGVCAVVLPAHAQQNAQPIIIEPPPGQTQNLPPSQNCDPDKPGPECGSSTNVVNTSQSGMPQVSATTPGSDDLAVKIMRRLFGSPVDVALTTYMAGTSPNATQSNQQFVTLTSFIAAMMVGIALLLGGILFMWTLIMGLMNTQTSGQFLGRWNSAMVPFRMFLGIGLAYPLPWLGGLCTAQIIAISLALLGNGTASALYSQIVTHSLTTPAIEIELADTARDAFWEMLGAAVCIQAANEFGYDTNGGPHRITYYDQVSTRLERTGLTSSTTRTVVFGHNGICGTTSMAVCASAADGCSGSQTAGSSSANRPAWTEALNNAVAAEMTQHVIALTGAAWSPPTNDQNRYPPRPDIAEMAVNGQKVFTKFGEDIAKHIKAHGAGSSHPFEERPMIVEAARHFESIIRQQATSIVSSYSQERTAQAQEAITRGGWIYAGSYYWIFEQQQDYIASAIQESFRVDIRNNYLFKAEAWLSGFISFISGTTPLAQLQTTIDKFDAYRKGNAIDDTDQIRNLVSSGGLDDLFSSMGVWISKVVMNKILGSTINAGAPSPSELNRSPMVKLRSMGDTMTNSALAIAGGGRLWSEKTKDAKPKDNQNEKGGTGAIAGIMGTILGLMITLGVVLGVILPALPMVFWLLAVISYFIYVIEAVYAAPFWAVMHSNPDGNDLTGSGAKGYPLLLNLTLSPILILAGLFVGMALFRVSHWVIDLLWWDAMGMTRIGAWNPFSMIGTIALYAVLMLLVAYKCLSLITELRESVLNWMGASRGNDLLPNEGKGMALAVVGGGGGKVAQSMTAALGRQAPSPAALR